MKRLRSTLCRREQDYLVFEELLPEELAQTSAKMEALRQNSTEQKMNRGSSY